MQPKSLLLLLSMASITSLASAENLTGNRLWEEAQEYSHARDIGFEKAGPSFYVAHFVGYIDGVAESNADIPRCLPAGVSRGQIADVVIAFLRDNPALRHQSAALLVNLAIYDAFPTCGSRRK